MIGIYFSGTGNTKYCVEKFLSYYGNTIEMYSIEDKEAIHAIQTHRDIVFAYPVFYSNLPKIATDFLSHYKDVFRNKNVFLIATMATFSGDGTGCAARILKKYGAHILGGLHLKMPNSIGDIRFMLKKAEQQRVMIEKTDIKIEQAVKKLKHGKPTRHGLHTYEQAAGFISQRLWFSKKTNQYHEGVKLQSASCGGCGTCVKKCPMSNIQIADNKAVFSNQCTLCYRCFANCPNKAITILGKQVIMQNNVFQVVEQGSANA